ncbi:MAG TPA: Rrf2 family transcriptional regulator [Candidatus Krumholzibacteria bacterium]|nr:Rrf2 family transcriptional regulator [Candidatus Krumholzibacteria bacterium]
MIISRSADYALRAIVYLARLDSHRYVPANEIANEMQTPPFLLSRLLQHLVKNEILLSMKGHHGGFKLRLSPDRITAYDVIQLIDGPFLMHDCSGHCGLSNDCNLKHVFGLAEKSLESMFNDLTMAELAQPRWNNTIPQRKEHVHFNHVVQAVD